MHASAPSHLPLLRYASSVVPCEAVESDRRTQKDLGGRQDDYPSPESCRTDQNGGSRRRQRVPRPFPMRAAQRSSCVCPIFLRMTSDGIHELPRQRCDAAEALKKIQRHAFGFENRARKAAQLNDNVASVYGSAIRLMDLDIRRGIDLPENFCSRRGAGK